MYCANLTLTVVVIGYMDFNIWFILNQYSICKTLYGFVRFTKGQFKHKWGKQSPSKVPLQAVYQVDFTEMTLNQFCFSVCMQTSKEDLLQADFEGALKFFRVQLPKRYRAAENARRLMEQACNIKVRQLQTSVKLQTIKRCALLMYFYFILALFWLL